MTILIVEDSDADAELIERALKGSHQYAHLERAKDLKTCVNRVKAGGVDMVLLDLGLPDATGINALSEIIAVDKRMPIVIITGDNRGIEEAAQAGAKDYILKHRMNEKRIVDAVAYIRREIERGDKLQRGCTLIKDSFEKATNNATRISHGNHAIARASH